MAKKRQTFGKMQRERDRAEKRARKQEKKEERKAAALAAADPAVAEELGIVDGEEPGDPEQAAIPSGEAEESGSPPEPA
jgi:hypothetical protein